MIVHLDTSALVDALTGPRRSLPTLRRLIDAGDRPAISTLALYEWLRGPRTPSDLSVQEDLFPAELAVAFGPVEAAVAAQLYERIERPRGREIDLAIAASAIANGASIWTLNRADFRDIPGIRLV